MKKITFAILSIILFSCQEKLPKPTETGNNTFGCKINGKTWIPDGNGAFISPQKPIGGGFQNIANSGVLTIYIYTINSKGEEVQFYVESQNTGTYLLNKDTGFIPSTIFPKNHGLYRKNGVTYITNSTNTGKVIITKSDKPSGIISGTFEFTAVAGTEKVIITNGRFDINTKNL